MRAFCILLQQQPNKKNTLNNGNEILKVKAYEQKILFVCMIENNYFSDHYFIRALKDEGVRFGQKY